MQNVTFVALTVPEIWRESRNFKSRSRDPFPTSFDLILLFFSLVPMVINLLAKFDASSFNRSRDMEGVPKFQN